MSDYKINNNYIILYDSLSESIIDILIILVYNKFVNNPTSLIYDINLLFISDVTTWYTNMFFIFILFNFYVKFHDDPLQ